MLDGWHPSKEGTHIPSWRFFSKGNAMIQIDSLYTAVRHISVTPKPKTKTAKLIATGRHRMDNKVGEEAVEVAIAAVANDKRETVLESADLIYHLVVLWADMGIDPKRVWEEIGRRCNSKAIV